MLTLAKKYQFLFEELVKRDFKQKYKRTVLGMAWSILSPLLQLLVMSVVFTQFFGRTQAHYTIYLFCGNPVFNYFKESTSTGMFSLMSNSGIITKVNVPKYMFLLSKNVSSLLNFGLYNPKLSNDETFLDSRNIYFGTLTLVMMPLLDISENIPVEVDSLK